MGQSALERLAETKLELARKYDNLALKAGSVPKRKTYVRQADKFRRQAGELKRRAAN